MEDRLDRSYRRGWARQLENRIGKYPVGNRCREYLAGAAHALRNHSDWILGDAAGYGGGFYDFETREITLDQHSFWYTNDDSGVWGPIEPGNDSHGQWADLFARMIHEGWHAFNKDRVEGTEAKWAGENCGPPLTSS